MNPDSQYLHGCTERNQNMQDKQYFLYRQTVLYIYMNTKTLCSQFNKMCPVFFLPLFVATDGNMQVDVPQYYKKQFFFFFNISELEQYCMLIFKESFYGWFSHILLLFSL